MYALSSLNAINNIGMSNFGNRLVAVSRVLNFGFRMSKPLALYICQPSNSLKRAMTVRDSFPLSFKDVNSDTKPVSYANHADGSPSEL